jgi:hypothetical protein
MVKDYTLYRYATSESSTLGLLMAKNGLGTLEFQCYTLEDTHRPEKVNGETRIPAGRYQIKLRDEGSVVKRYKERYPWHRGMLWLQGVENFEWIYIHQGNTDKHTEGCILVGDSAHSNNLNNGRLSNSADAYLWVYKRMAAEIEEGDEVFIQIEDVA